MDLFTLLEDRTQGFLHLLKGSKAPVPKRFMLAGDVFTPDVKTIGDLDQSVLMSVIEDVDDAIDPEFRKYEEYFIQQIAKGNMPLDKIREDGERFNITLRLFQKLSRKAIWKGPKNIFQYDNWRELEKITRKLAKEANVPEEEDTTSSKDSVILFTKTYQDTRAEIFGSIFDEPSDVPQTVPKTYYLRKILTPEGACRYGKGTTWCTATKGIKKQVTVDDMTADIKKANSWRQPSAPEPELFAGEKPTNDEIFRQWAPQHSGLHLYDNAGAFIPANLTKVSAAVPQDFAKNILDFKAGKTDWIYNPAYYSSYAMQYIAHGLYIIELQDDKPRRPILQISSDQIMTTQDVPVTGTGSRMKDFIKSAIAAVPSEKLQGFKNIL